MKTNFISHEGELLAGWHIGHKLGKRDFSEWLDDWKLLDGKAKA